MFNYQKNNRYFASVADDIKDIAETELINLGAQAITPGYKGVYFTASKESLYTINLYARLINRVIAPLVTFSAMSEDELYKSAYNIEWEKLFTNKETFAIFASVSKSNITHSKYASLKLKDAVVDRFRNLTGIRPNVDPKDPDIWFNLHIEENSAVISVDTSGGSLHRRGYRKDAVEAPMVETLAASIIKLAEWDCNTPIYDPMCGSGTLLCEAYLMATNTPSAFNRTKFGFERLPDFDKELWKSIKEKSRQNIKPLKDGLIAGSDVSREAVRATLKNLDSINPNHNIQIRQVNMFDIKELSNTTIVCNPPYGIRLKSNVDLSDFYKSVGDFLKQKCKGSNAYIYFGDREYLKKIYLKAKWKKPLQNGGLDGRLAKFEMF